MKKGFTLIELLIVISIIGILAVALLPNILSAPATARDAGNKAALNGMISALEQVKAATGSYPGAAGVAEIMENTNADVASVKEMLKGKEFPLSSALAAATDPTVMGVTIGAVYNGAVPMVYCPLHANNSGYSYIIAVKMEQSVGGENALDLSKACDAGIVSGSTYAAPTTSSSSWYYMAQ